MLTAMNPKQRGRYRDRVFRRWLRSQRERGSLERETKQARYNRRMGQREREARRGVPGKSRWVNGRLRPIVHRPPPSTALRDFSKFMALAPRIDWGDPRDHIVDAIEMNKSTLGYMLRGAPISALLGR